MTSFPLELDIVFMKEEKRAVNSYCLFQLKTTLQTRIIRNVIANKDKNYG